ncbi:MAG: signal peptidase I [Alphaproteobacteria bacterium]|nr:signal peptidase I [Alphaproteobacteria bacterium]
MTAMSSSTQTKINWAKETREIALLILAVLGFHSAIAKPFYIPSESMLPTLLVGDRLVVTKYPYGYSYLSPAIPFVNTPILPKTDGRLLGGYPERGDIAVVKSPIDHVDYIKRVVGLPGDTIQMKGGALYINGVAVKRVALAPAEIVESPVTGCERYPQYRTLRADGATVCRYPRFRETLPNGVSYDTLDAEPNNIFDNTAPVTVPQGFVFLMGDNRDNSADSRVDPAIGGLGILPVENVVGRAEFITFSLDGTTDLFSPGTWFSAFRSGRAFTSLHPSTEG